VPTTYKQSGVDIERGDALVDWLRSEELRSENDGPHQDKIISGVGGFAALFQPDLQGIAKPTLVSCTDGVGTKLKIAMHFKSYASVAQDLVAMNVNDLICCGAQPLFFLDYFATSHLDLAQAKEFLLGLKAACHASDLALIGGETAEMPGFYQKGDFDCAGFCVGMVDGTRILGPQRVKPGARLLGLPSSGFHSNGYSLLRRVFADDLDAHRDLLLKPTALYVQVAKALQATGGVQAMAHITGGGIWNLLRVIPDSLAVHIKAWRIPQAFLEVKERAELPWDEMLKTLNCGLGFVVVVDPAKWSQALDAARAQGFEPMDLGVVITANGDDRLSWQGAGFL
jgi:phosphoribosylformylglycinamidine cyclo-ligase